MAAMMLHALVTLSAIAAVAGQRGLEEPTTTTGDVDISNATAEWEATKESKMAAVNKIVKMMEDIRSQVNTEGEEEAKMYNEFACFCKDTIKEKGEAIQDGEDSKTSLTADIEDLSSTRDGLDTDIKDIEKVLEDTNKLMKEAQETRDGELKQYTADEADLAAALEALKGAIKELKASKTFVNSAYEGFLQTKREAVGQKVQSALLLAEALGFAPEAVKRATAFFQTGAPPEIPTEAYTFKSGSIIETLEGLQKTFTDKKTEVDKTEVDAVAAHDMLMQDYANIVKTKDKELEDKKKERAEKVEEIATKSNELTTVAAVLLDDQEYLKELAKMCHEKAVTWDQRSDMRVEELQALTAVLGILKGEVSDKMSGATVRFNQFAVTLKRAEATARDEKAMEAVEANAEAVESGAAPSFLQTVSRRGSGRTPANDEKARQAVINLLRGSSVHLKSSALATLVSQLAEDPFAKIKTLIEELIERLLKEAANEANQKGWCDKSMSAATQKRDYAAEEIAELNSNMAELEAVRDKLAEELSVLADEIQKLKDDRDEAKKIRTRESAEHKKIVEEAEFGVSAMKDAIKIIDQFYKKARKAEVDLSLLQKQEPKEEPEFGAGAEDSYNPAVINTAKPTAAPVAPSDQAPDAGFAGGEAYTGAAGVEGGVLGMMEVILGDFERTITETEKAEAEAEQEHLEFMTETGKSKAEKEMAESEKIKQQDDAVEKLSNDKDSLTSQTDILKTAVEELIQLHGACIDTGMSVEDRFAAREDEIESLKKALCVLESYEKYGPKGIGDDGSC